MVSSPASTRCDGAEDTRAAAGAWRKGVKGSGKAVEVGVVGATQVGVVVLRVFEVRGNAEAGNVGRWSGIVQRKRGRARIAQGITGYGGGVVDHGRRSTGGL